MKTTKSFFLPRLKSQLSIAFCLSSVFTYGFAQDQNTISTTQIRSLLSKASDKNDEVSEPARQALSKLGRSAIPVLVDIVEKGNGCRERTAAANFVIDIDPGNEAIVPALVEISKGRTMFSSEEELLCRRGATFSLAFSVAGIKALTQLLTDKDLFVRRSAIFSFDELTETANYPDGSLPAMKDAIPVIAKATKDDDGVMNRMAEEVLSQIIGRGDEELSKAAKQARDRLKLHHRG